jgi:type II secretory pathway pseudopilin PulG
MNKNTQKINNRGYMLIQVIVFSAIAVYMLGALVGWAVINVKASRQNFNQEQALQIAEAGIDYYRWHLAHAPTDFQDGVATSGPYTHNFKDKNGNVIGTFSLSITPPSLGSTLVTIESIGQVNDDPDISRTIRTRLAKPSMAKYAVVAHSDMRFGAGTEIFGPIHSNGGIRFDGLAHNIVSSNKTNYTDPDSGFDEYGVHTTVSPMDPSPPGILSERPDIFMAGRQFPLPIVEFNGITADLALMKTAAQTNGFWRASSTASGYHLVLKTNDTFDLRKVTGLYSKGSCSNEKWSIQNETLIGNYPLPNNGLIFLEDNVWVDGQINSARLTIIAAVLPDAVATRKNITINNDLLYTNYDGTDVVGLIAQNNINVGLRSDDDLRIDGALIAQKGRVGRYQYSSGCSSSYYKRQIITLYGMIGTYLRYGFAYTDGTGYQIRNLNYDANLLYSPPPDFPLTSDQYITLSWEEVK